MPSLILQGYNNGIPDTVETTEFTRHGRADKFGERLIFSFTPAVRYEAHNADMTRQEKVDGVFIELNNPEGIQAGDMVTVTGTVDAFTRYAKGGSPETPLAVYTIPKTTVTSVRKMGCTPVN